MLTTHLKRLFAALILAQAAHSVEEFAGRLYESFPPARLVSGLIAEDQRRGFLIANLVIVSMGAWCALVPVGRGWPVARRVAAVWLSIELLNGTGHLLWSWLQGDYTPGAATAPLLIGLAWLLGRELIRSRAESA
jgi:hypothetical protein